MCKSNVTVQRRADLRALARYPSPSAATGCHTLARRDSEKFIRNSTGIGLLLQYSNQTWRLEHRYWRDDWLFERNICPVTLPHFLPYNWIRQVELLDLLKLSNADAQLALIDFPD